MHQSADLDNVATTIMTRRNRKIRLEIITQHATAQFPVEGIERCRSNVDEDLIFRNLRDIGRGDVEDIPVPVAGY